MSGLRGFDAVQSLRASSLSDFAAQRQRSENCLRDRSQGRKSKADVGWCCYAVGMSTRLVNVDRLTPMLLPPDLRDWVPADHIVHLILDAVSRLPKERFEFNWRGTGSEQYPPEVMLSVLIYCYCTGRFSSRVIEQATYSDVVVRYICGNTHPDHDTICTFRVQNKELFEEAFVAVLTMARETGCVKKVGTVAVAGTKVKANASKHAASAGHKGGA